MRVALTIAGSDPGGGAGIQADLKTFAAFGVHGLSAPAALTVQDTREVTAIQELPDEFVLAQIRAVVLDIGVDAVKTGMLASASLVRAVAAGIRELGIPNLVVDPVLVSKSGTALLRPGAVKALREDLLPLARVATPNLPEAEALVGAALTSLQEIQRAAREIRSMDRISRAAR